MNNFLSITSNAASQIKKIMSNAPDGVDSLVVGVVLDKTTSAKKNTSKFVQKDNMDVVADMINMM